MEEEGRWRWKGDKYKHPNMTQRFCSKLQKRKKRRIQDREVGKEQIRSQQWYWKETDRVCLTRQLKIITELCRKHDALQMKLQGNRIVKVNRQSQGQIMEMNRFDLPCKTIENHYENCVENMVYSTSNETNI